MITAKFGIDRTANWVLQPSEVEHLSHNFLNERPDKHFARASFKFIASTWTKRDPDVSRPWLKENPVTAVEGHIKLVNRQYHVGAEGELLVEPDGDFRQIPSTLIGGPEYHVATARLTEAINSGLELEESGIGQSLGEMIVGYTRLAAALRRGCDAFVALRKQSEGKRSKKFLKAKVLRRLTKQYNAARRYRAYENYRKQRKEALKEYLRKVRAFYETKKRDGVVDQTKPPRFEYPPFVPPPKVPLPTSEYNKAVDAFGVTQRAIKASAGGYLAYVWALKPTYESVAKLKKQLETGSVVTRRFRRGVNYFEEVQYGNYLRTYMARRVARVYTAKGFYPSFGRKLRNFTVTAWQVLPMSFITDWFVNISSFIRYMTISHQDIEKVWESQRGSIQYTYTGRSKIIKQYERLPSGKARYVKDVGLVRTYYDATYRIWRRVQLHLSRATYHWALLFNNWYGNKAAVDKLISTTILAISQRRIT